MGMRYGVQYQYPTGVIEAGAVRKVGELEAFIMACDVTTQAIGATAQWLVMHNDLQPYRITDRHGNVYELAARMVVK